MNSGALHQQLPRRAKNRDEGPTLWYADCMPPEPDLTGATDLTCTLRAAAAVSESLKPARQEIALLVRFGRSRPSWQPACPFLADDEDLARRLGLLADRIDGARKRLIDKRVDLLRDAPVRSPLARPPELQKHIDYINLLCTHARSGKLKEFLQVYKQAPAAMFPNPDLSAVIEGL
jgi:hypothetical protein